MSIGKATRKLKLRTTPELNAITIKPDDAKLDATNTINNGLQQMWNTRQNILSAVNQSVRKWHIECDRSYCEQVYITGL